MRNKITILLFALLTLCASSGAFAAQKSVRLASQAADSVDTDVASGTWTSSFYRVDTSKPVQCAVVLGTVTGNITITLEGYPKIPGDSWGGGSNYITLISRGSITSAGRYMLQVSPAGSANSSTTYGLMPNVRVKVVTDSATDTNFDAYIIYHTVESAD